MTQKFSCATTSWIMGGLWKFLAEVLSIKVAFHEKYKLSDNLCSAFKNHEWVKKSSATEASEFCFSWE